MMWLLLEQKPVTDNAEFAGKALRREVAGYRGSVADG